MFGESCWVANVSDGSTHIERWTGEGVSPWRALMTYCKANGAYVTNLRMTVGTKTVSCPSNAVGYWQANALPSVQGIECDPEIHTWHGIGWVEGDTVNVIWGAMDPRTHQVAFWRDTKSVESQGQIIWGKQEKEIEHVQVTNEMVRGMREYAKYIEVEKYGTTG